MIKTESDFRLQLPFSIISIPLHFCPSSGPGPNLLLKSGLDMTGHVAGIEERTANSRNFRDVFFVPQTARLPL
jgi:hypothetical protein